MAKSNREIPNPVSSWWSMVKRAEYSDSLAYLAPRIALFRTCGAIPKASSLRSMKIDSNPLGYQLYNLFSTPINAIYSPPKYFFSDTSGPAAGQLDFKVYVVHTTSTSSRWQRLRMRIEDPAEST
ncbi:hypothetical protein PM082_006977 [Marasmius tenuissimus]|nr:hypothetical protein PM082_006977 [Marasmius tenuissimus]